MQEFITMSNQELHRVEVVNGGVFLHKDGEDRIQKNWRYKNAHHQSPNIYLI